jgi:hypothetical protein
LGAPGRLLLTLAFDHDDVAGGRLREPQARLHQEEQEQQAPGDEAEGDASGQVEATS